MIDIIIARVIGAVMFGGLCAVTFGSCSYDPYEDADTLLGTTGLEHKQYVTHHGLDWEVQVPKDTIYLHADIHTGGLREAHTRDTAIIMHRGDYTHLYVGSREVIWQGNAYTGMAWQ